MGTQTRNRSPFGECSVAMGCGWPAMSLADVPTRHAVGCSAITLAPMAAAAGIVTDAELIRAVADVAELMLARADVLFGGAQVTKPVEREEIEDAATSLLAARGITSPAVLVPLFVAATIGGRPVHFDRQLDGRLTYLDTGAPVPYVLADAFARAGA